MVMYDVNKEPQCELEFDEDFKKRLIDIIERSMHGTIDNNADAAILFHWLRHQDDPAYSFVPEEYRGTR